MSRFRFVQKHLTFANVAAFAALFIALSTGAYAAFNFPKNSISAKELTKNSVGTSEIKQDSVASEEIADRGIKLVDLAQGKTGGPKPLPATCPPGQVLGWSDAFGFRCHGEDSLPPYNTGLLPCPEGPPNPGAHCLPVPGVNTPEEVNEEPPGLPVCPEEAKAAELCVNPEQPLAPGATVTGVIGKIGPLQPSKTYHAYASLPQPATSPISAGNILIDEVLDPNNLCTGSYGEPTAPNQVVCIYLIHSAGTSLIEGEALSVNAANRFGFSMKIKTAATVPDEAGAEGVWAYTGHGPGGGP